MSSFIVVDVDTWEPLQRFLGHPFALHRRGSEVHLMVQAHQELAAGGLKVRRGPLVPGPPGISNGHGSMDHQLYHQLYGITRSMPSHLGITSCTAFKLAGL